MDTSELIYKWMMSGVADEEIARGLSVKVGDVYKKTSGEYHGVSIIDTITGVTND